MKGQNDIRSQSSMEMDLPEVLKSRLSASSPPHVYQPQDIPGLTRFPVRSHPQADKVSKEIDDLLLENFPFRTERHRETHIKADHNKWGCMAFSLARDDRILDGVKVMTLFFLVDGRIFRFRVLRFTKILTLTMDPDLQEDMSLEEGKALFAKLIPLVKGTRLPDRNDALEWLTYDTFASMRECDDGLTDEMVKKIDCRHESASGSRSSEM